MDDATDTQTAPPEEPKFFDLAELDLLSPSNEGRPMELVHPSGVPYRTSSGETVVVRLRGRHSDAARALLKQLGDEIAEIRDRGGKITPEIEKDHDTRYLVAVTVDWTIERLDGVPFLVTPANVQKLWTDARFTWLRVRALNFISADGVFLRPPG